MNIIESFVVTLLLIFVVTEGMIIKVLLNEYKKKSVKEELLIDIIKERYGKHEREDPYIRTIVSSGKQGKGRAS